MKSEIKKAVISVASLGTRVLPATKAISKELLPIYNRPLIHHVIDEAVQAGIEEIIFVTRSGKEAIQDHFEANFDCGSKKGFIGANIAFAKKDSSMARYMKEILK